MQWYQCVLFGKCECVKLMMWNVRVLGFIFLV
jgi:hypothetical protein